MDQIYPVQLEGEKVGNAWVSREGLYYRIRCKCCLPVGRHWRIKVCNVDLGVCCQDGRERTLQTRIPVKQITDVLVFTAYLPEVQNVYPVCESEPFPEPERLLSMEFLRLGGEAVLRLKIPEPNQPGSDRNP